MSWFDLFVGGAAAPAVSSGLGMAGGAGMRHINPALGVAATDPNYAQQQQALAAVQPYATTGAQTPKYPYQINPNVAKNNYDVRLLGGSLDNGTGGTNDVGGNPGDPGWNEQGPGYNPNFTPKVDWGGLQSRLNPNMTPEEFDQWVRDAFAAQGKTATDADLAAWRGYWNSWGKNDPGYFMKRFTTPDGADGGTGPAGMQGPPTLAELQNMPGFQFALQNGQNMLQRGAAARGTLLTGGTLKDLSDYTTNMSLNSAFFPYWQLSNQSKENNANNLYNLANLGLNASSVGGQ